MSPYLAGNIMPLQCKGKTTNAVLRNNRSWLPQWYKTELNVKLGDCTFKGPIRRASRFLGKVKQVSWGWDRICESSELQVLISEWPAGARWYAQANDLALKGTGVRHRWGNLTLWRAKYRYNKNNPTILARLDILLNRRLTDDEIRNLKRPARILVTIMTELWGAGENQKNPVSGPRFEPRTSEVLNTTVKYSVNLNYTV